MHDTQTNRTKIVSVDDNGVQLSYWNSCGGSQIQMSEDARFVIFNAGNDIRVYDMKTGKSEIVSVNGAGGTPNGWSTSPNMSPNGRFITFVSTASNLVPNDINRMQDIFIRENPLWSE